jgi:hypothetical protein
MIISWSTVIVVAALIGAVSLLLTPNNKLSLLMRVLKYVVLAILLLSFLSVVTDGAVFRQIGVRVS